MQRSSKILLSILVPASLIVTGCSSKVEEKSLNQNTAGIELMKNKEDAKKELEIKIEKSKKIFSSMKKVFQMAKLFSQGSQTLVDFIKVLDSINDEASQTLPEIDKNNGIAVKGTTRIQSDILKDNCDNVEYIVENTKTELIYHLKTCHSSDAFLPLLKITVDQEKKTSITEFYSDNLAKLFPKEELLKKIKECNFVGSEESKLSCDNLPVAADQNSLTLMDVREIEDFYFLTGRVIEISTGAVVKTGFAKIDKKGRVISAAWSDENKKPIKNL